MRYNRIQTSGWYLPILLIIVLYLISSISFMTGNVFADLTFSDTLNISHDAQFSGFPEIASVGSNVYLTWLRDSSQVPLGASVMFSRSTDNGITFSEPISLSGEPDRSGITELNIAAAGSNVYVTWVYGGFTTEPILLTRSSDYGVTFSSPVDIKDSDVDGHTSNVEIAAEGDSFFATWLVGFLPETDIYLTGSSDSGGTFSTPVKVADDSHYPQIALSEGLLYLSWNGLSATNQGVHVVKSTDGGVTLSDPLRLNGDFGSGFARIAASGDNVHVTWGSGVIIVASSNNAGDSFEDPIALSPTYRNSDRPSITSEGSIVYIAYVDFYSGLMLTSSSDGGLTFTEPVEVSTTDTPEGTWPVLLSAGNSIYVIYVDTAEREIFISQSHDGGSTFHEPLNLSNMEDFSLLPVAVLAGNLIHLAWHDLGHSQGDVEVFYTRGIQTGVAGDTVPPEVIISSATDGDGNLVTEFGSTTSDSIIFVFTATDDQGTVDHFDCYLISSEGVVTDELCTSPMNYHSLTVGHYQFVANATDDSGNQGIATFSFEVATLPTIVGIIEEIEDMDLPSPVRNGLIAPLKIAQELIEDDNPKNDRAACGKLGAFLAKIEAKENAGKLTSSQATALREFAANVKTEIGCKK